MYLFFNHWSFCVRIYENSIFDIWSWNLGLKFLTNFNEDIVMNGQTMNNRCGDYGICVDSYEWEKSLPSPCEIEVKIKIFGVEAQNFSERITMPEWLTSKVGFSEHNKKLHWFIIWQKKSVFVHSMIDFS